ncbi:MAG: SUMF1/EgtB/PvdO family nonheme iron enzyme [Alphaproteobacteria bacterium]|nr:SUMF1/EgtB/PvdO family nonheme iron enzyme [Alphaproteobacteria bacterium]
MERIGAFAGYGMGRPGLIARAAIALTFVGLSSATAAAQLEKRIALVIGNSAYKDQPLQNPGNDARAVAARLRQLGFDVVMRENATRAQFSTGIAEFAGKVTSTSVALFYYAGHGMQVRARNYLIPVDAEIETESSVPFSAIDVGLINETMDQTGARVRLMVLDACRNNPFERRRGLGASRGLAPMEAAHGALVAFATAPGSVAADGDGANSVYTGALLKALEEPGLKAEEVFKRARLMVLEQTRGAQTPWEQSALVGDLVLNQSAGGAAAGAVATADREAIFWQSVQASNRPDEYEAYLKQYPQGVFAALARSRLQMANAQPAMPTIPPLPPLPTIPTPTISTLASAAATPPKPATVIDMIDKEYVAAQTIRLREAPDMRSKQLAVLREGALLTIVGKVNGRPWLQVDRGGTAPAYVSAWLVEERKAYWKRRGADQLQAGLVASFAAATAGPRGPRDCEFCPEMVTIPAGSFMMGSPPTEIGRSDAEGPQHLVSIRSFAAGKYEVTVGEWAACVADGGCSRHLEEKSWAIAARRDNHPVTNVSWEDATQYAVWLSRRTGKRYRLLTEAEWEYAARAGTTTPYNTGMSITQEQANFVADDKSVYYEQTVDVGSFLPNRFGLHDMHGNAWEWVEDCYNPTYIEAPANGGAWTSGDCSKRVVRGGSWSNLPSGIRSAFRSKSTVATRYDNYGFRVARTD